MARRLLRVRARHEVGHTYSQPDLIIAATALHFQFLASPNKLVSMTSLTSSPAIPREPGDSPNTWRLQDAKARFSELVRRSQSEGPQHVTLHGKDAVVVVDATQFRRLTEARDGSTLIDALQARPYPDLELVAEGAPMPVRELDW